MKTKVKKDDLDRLTEKLVKQDPSLADEFEKSDRAIDIGLQMYDLRRQGGKSFKSKT